MVSLVIKVIQLFDGTELTSIHALLIKTMAMLLLLLETQEFIGYIFQINKLLLLHNKCKMMKESTHSDNGTQIKRTFLGVETTIPTLTQVAHFNVSAASSLKKLS